MKKIFSCLTVVLTVCIILCTPAFASEKGKVLPSDVSLGGVSVGSTVSEVRGVHGAPTKITEEYDDLGTILALT